MRRFLYISPFFPPMTRVGGLRPLKFARHLPRFGWAPVVLCDLRASDAVDPALLDVVPESTIVVREYSRRASTVDPARPGTPNTTPRPTSSHGHSHSQGHSRGPRLRPRRPKLRAEDINPLGAHAFGIRHALASAKAALKTHPDCEAIVVNADPYAAMVVGTRLAETTGLPLIHDLRDPWSCCELRRPLRPRPQRAIVDRVERRAVERAAAVILNTRTTLRDYRRHYADLPAERFTCIRNHADAELIAHGQRPPFDRFTLLFMGNFRRFVEGDTVIEALVQIKAAGFDASRFQLAVTGSVPPEAWSLAERAGVVDMIVDHPFVPYLEVGPLMARADLLLSFSHPTAQRIPAKVYDYLVSDRPVLVVADNPELAELAAAAGGAKVCPRGDADAIAAAILGTIEGARTPVVRDLARVGLDSVTASQTLAGILDRVTAGGAR